MAKGAADDDFSTNIDESGPPDLASQWPSIVQIVRDLAAVWKGVEIEDSPPDGILTDIYLGRSDERFRMRIRYNHPNMVFDYNTGTDASPSWSNIFTLSGTLGLLVLTGSLVINGSIAGLTSLTLAGDLDMDSNDILNGGAVTATSYNGLDVTAHGARHAPGGADALPTAAPSNVGTANAEGSAATIARADHVHRGISALQAESGASVYGVVDFQAGGFMDVSRSGQVITIKETAWTRQSMTSSQTGISFGTETFINQLNALGFPGTADGTKAYRVRGAITAEANANAHTVMRVRAYHGATGASTGETQIFDHAISANLSNNNPNTMSFEIPRFVPAASDLLGFTIENSANAVDVIGTGLLASYIEIREVA